jgi:hypothetical protein
MFAIVTYTIQVTVRDKYFEFLTADECRLTQINADIFDNISTFARDLVFSERMREQVTIQSQLGIGSTFILTL